MAGEKSSDLASATGDNHNHSHAKINDDRVRADLLPSCYRLEQDVVQHFQKLIAYRQELNTPFYIGATVRHPVERFHLETYPPHSTIYKEMVVGWVGTATIARRIESLVISMACSLWPDHCMNKPGTGGEGIAKGDHSASVYMCQGGRPSLLRRPQAASQARLCRPRCNCLLCR